MQLTLWLVALVVGAADPFLWIAPIIAAFFSKGRWWVVPLAALIWGGVLEFALRPQLMPGYAGEQMGLHLASALLNGFVVFGIASLIRKLRKRAPGLSGGNDPAFPLAEIGRIPQTGVEEDPMANQERGNFGKRQGAPLGTTAPVEKLQGIADTRDPLQIADAVIAHMEAKLPQVWYVFLHVTGLDMALAHFLPVHPFAGTSPAVAAMEREVARLTPDGAEIQCAAVVQAMAALIRKHNLVSKHLEFYPPWPHERDD